MRIYFSGIGGVAIGPLAEIAMDAGFQVTGSDRSPSLITSQLEGRGMTLHVGDQDGAFLRTEHAKSPFDYFVYTASLTVNHPEILAAKELGIPTLKRDGLLSKLIEENNLSLIAVAGTHGKTTTTGLLVWCLKKLGIPISYSVGSTISFGPSGLYDPNSRYFIYECDEFDRNFLHFWPELAVITSVDYDHPDTYPDKEDYKTAFRQFIGQSKEVVLWQKDAKYLSEIVASESVAILEDNTALDQIGLIGIHLRQNAYLAWQVLRRISSASDEEIKKIIDSFPGTGRRMEKLAENLYSDYGHHPREITATLEAASELSKNIVLVYQPHQNKRQIDIRNDYTDAVFQRADTVYWLPTYLSREDPALAVLTPEQLSENLKHTDIKISAMSDDLWQDITRLRRDGSLVVLMGAGSIDTWAREMLQTDLSAAQ